MANLNIDTGLVRLTVNDDPDRIIEFNPTDAIFAEKFYQAMNEYQVKMQEFVERAKVLQNLPDDEKEGAMGAMIDLTKEVCTYTRKQIDTAFGEGTSQTAFGDTQSVYMFESFFDGIMPFFEQVRKEKIERYKKPAVKEREAMEKAAQKRRKA